MAHWLKHSSLMLTVSGSNTACARHLSNTPSVVNDYTRLSSGHGRWRWWGVLPILSYTAAVESPLFNSHVSTQRLTMEMTFTFTSIICYCIHMQMSRSIHNHYKSDKASVHQSKSEKVAMCYASYAVAGTSWLSNIRFSLKPMAKGMAFTFCPWW